MGVCGQRATMTATACMHGAFGSRDDVTAQGGNSGPPVRNRFLILDWGTLPFKRGDTLPLLRRRVHGDSRCHVQLTAHSGMNSLRALGPDITLRFPPLARGAA